MTSEANAINIVYVYIYRFIKFYSRSWAGTSMPEPTEESPDPVKGLIEYGDADESGYGVEAAKEETTEDSPEKREERQARSIALEKAYVHEVYQHIAPHFLQRKYRAWPRVKQFLLGLEPGSLVADVGKTLRTSI